MRLSGNQISAIAKLSWTMIMIDGKVEEHEVLASLLGLAIFDIPEGKAKQIFENAAEISYEYAAEIIADMNYEQKRYFCAYMGLIMAADGKINKNELAWWQALSMATSLPKMNLKEAIDIMSNYLNVDKIIKKPPIIVRILKGIWRIICGFVKLIFGIR